MKTIWTIVSVLALANMLVVLGVVGFLAGTGRLDRGRVESVRQVFKETIAAQAARAANEAIEAEAQRKVAEDAAKPPREPATASGVNAIRIAMTEAEVQQIKARMQELTILKDTLRQEREALDRDWEALRAAQRTFDGNRRRIAEREGAAQFKKTLGILEKLSASDVAQTLTVMLGAAPERPGKDQVVSYLNAMSTKVRPDVIAEFVRADPALAAELLEAIRTHGIEPPPSGVASK